LPSDFSTFVTSPLSNFGAPISTRGSGAAAPASRGGSGGGGSPCGGGGTQPASRSSGSKQRMNPR
jgi:hypothetical protein